MRNESLNDAVLGLSGPTQYGCPLSISRVDGISNTSEMANDVPPGPISHISAKDSRGIKMSSSDTRHESVLPSKLRLVLSQLMEFIPILNLFFNGNGSSAVMERLYCALFAAVSQ